MEISGRCVNIIVKDYRFCAVPDCQCLEFWTFQCFSSHQDKHHGAYTIGLVYRRVTLH